MELDRRRARWMLFFYLIYVVGVVYLLLTSNKYLYSHHELRTELAGARVDSIRPVPLPALQIKTSPGGSVTYWERGNPERTFHDSSGNTRDKDYVAEWRKVIGESPDGLAIEHWAADESGLYFTGKPASAIGVTPDGDIKWRFQFSGTATSPSPLEPVLDGSVVYVARPEGDVLAIEKSTGHLKWKIHAAQEIVSNPMLLGDELWMVVRSLDFGDAGAGDDQDSPPAKSSNKKVPVTQAFHKLLHIKRETGELVGQSSAFTVKAVAQMSFSHELKQIYVTSDNKLHCISQENGQLVWSQTVPDPIEGPAMIAEGHLFLSLTSGKIQAWDPAKKGKFEWEADISATPLSAPTYIPLFQRLAVITADQNMHVVDIKKAEHLWRFSLENRNPAHDVWSARLGGRLIEKLSMKWDKKGWTMWAPCSESRLCIYNPEKGQLVGRVNLPAPLLAPVFFTGKAFYALMLDKGKEGSKYVLARFMDEDAYKKKLKNSGEAAKAEPTKGADKGADKARAAAEPTDKSSL